jgi:hypothetical protein
MVWGVQGARAPCFSRPPHHRSRHFDLAHCQRGTNEIYFLIYIAKFEVVSRYRRFQVPFKNGHVVRDGSIESNSDPEN